MNIDELIKVYGENIRPALTDVLVNVRKDFVSKLDELNVPQDSYLIKEEFSIRDTEMVIDLTAIDHASGLIVDVKTGQLVQPEDGE